MAEATGDPYAAARTSLRDTAKWMAAVLSGLGAAVAAGITVSGFAALTGTALFLAVLAAAAAIGLILLAVGLLVRFLGVDAYYLTSLASDRALVARIDAAASDLLPPGVADFAALKRKRDAAYSSMAGVAHLPANDPARIAIEAGYAAWGREVGRILGFASFLKLRDELNRTMVRILVLFVLVSAILGWLGYQLAAGASKPPPALAATLDLAQGWEGLAADLGQLCGAGPFAVEVGKAPFTGWWTVTLQAPGACAGAVLTVPEAAARIAADPR